MGSEMCIRDSCYHSLSAQRRIRCVPRLRDRPARCCTSTSVLRDTWREGLLLRTTSLITLRLPLMIRLWWRLPLSLPNSIASHIVTRRRWRRLIAGEPTSRVGTVRPPGCTAGIVNEAVNVITMNAAAVFGARFAAVPPGLVKFASR